MREGVGDSDSKARGVGDSKARGTGESGDSKTRDTGDSNVMDMMNDISAIAISFTLITL